MVSFSENILANILCSTYVSPNLRYKDGQEVRTDARLKIMRDKHRSETYSLTLNLVKPTDAGDYEVRATNKLGTSTSLSHVTVLSKFLESIYNNSTFQIWTR